MFFSGMIPRPVWAMRKPTTLGLALCLAYGVASPVSAQPKGPVQMTALPANADKFQITDKERAACQADAIAFCAGTYPDEDQLLACMTQNRQSLTATCRTTFEAGLRKRHIQY